MPSSYEVSKEKYQEPRSNGTSTTDVSNGSLSDSSSDVEDRGEWGNKAEFILSCVGLSVGLGNVWRFPYLAYEYGGGLSVGLGNVWKFLYLAYEYGGGLSVGLGNVWRFPYLAYEYGGAAFLIAYLILQILIGKPMYMMELVMGQYSAKGPTAVWNMNPSAKGVGISMALISLVVAIYYNVIMAYTLYYFFSSMQGTLPWTKCKDEWIELGCVEQTTKKLEECTGNFTVDNGTRCLCSPSNYTFNSLLEVNCTNTSNVAVAEMFFERTVIQKSVGLHPEDVGTPIWQLALCLLLSWTIVVACLYKGVKSSGKVVYFTATFPYVILLILLIRGSLLDGAIDGVKYFIIPKWDKLASLEVWVAAAGQMFFSLSVSFGGIIMFGSYNKFKNNVYGDALLISIMDVVTSIIAGFVIFTTFGGMAKKIGVDVEDVAKGGYGLAFVAYPEALSNFPVPQLWSILFFFMLFTLGLDSEFALLETVLTCVQDEYPKLRKYKGFMCVGTGIVCYLLALPCVTPAGDYIVSLMDHYGADFSVLFVATCECIAVMWVYGVGRFVNDMSYMYGHPSAPICVGRFVNDMSYMLGHPPAPKYFWMACWAVISPLVIGALFLYRMIKYKAPEIRDDVPFPNHAQAIGWVITCMVLVPIPIMFIYKMYQANGSFMERLKTITTPTSEWGPNDGSDKRPISSDGMEMTRKYGLDNPGAINMHI